MSGLLGHCPSLLLAKASLAFGGGQGSPGLRSPGRVLRLGPGLTGDALAGNEVVKAIGERAERKPGCITDVEPDWDRESHCAAMPWFRIDFQRVGPGHYDSALGPLAARAAADTGRQAKLCKRRGSGRVDRRNIAWRGEEQW